MGATTPEQRRLATFQKGGDWSGMCDWFETLTPRQRGLLLTDWLQGLSKAQRWDRLLEVTTAAIAQVEPKGGAAISLERILRAQALSRLGRHREALEAHQENGALGFAEGYAYAAQEALTLQDWPALERIAKLRLGPSPQDEEALAHQALAVARQNRFEEAEPLLRAALERVADRPEIWLHLGRILLMHRKDLTAAEQAFDRCLALDPRHAEALNFRGAARMSQGRYEEARQDFLAAQTLAPQDAAIQANIQMADRYLEAHARAARKAPRK